MKKQWGAKGDLVSLYLLGEDGMQAEAGCMGHLPEEGDARLSESAPIVQSPEEGAAVQSENRQKEVVFVTDTRPVLSVLTAKGCYVIALLHEGNTQEDLSAAPYAMTEIAEMEYSAFCKAYERMAGLPWKILETDRCVVRETTEADVDSFYKIYSEPEMTRYTEGLFPDPEEERAYIRKYIREVYGFLGYGMWTILHRESGEIIGRAGLSWREGAEMPELGFLIGLPWQRQGYAYEVCRAILEFGKQELEFSSIQALVKKENRASVRLCEKLGFCNAGEVGVGEEVYEFYVTELEGAG